MGFCSYWVCTGAALILKAVADAGVVLAANTCLRPIIHAINREPLDTSVEFTNVVYVIAHRQRWKEVLALLECELKRSNHPAQDLPVHAFGQEEVEIEATLAATSVDRDELDGAVKRLAASPLISQAFWSPRTHD